MRKIMLVTPIVVSAALVLFGAGPASAAPGDTPATNTTSSIASSAPTAHWSTNGSRDF
jgi:hypothetical protein